MEFTYSSVLLSESGGLVLVELIFVVVLKAG